MIPFEDLVTSLERFKLRKSTPSAVPVVAPGAKAVSGKQQTKQGMGNVLDNLGDELISEE